MIFYQVTNGNYIAGYYKEKINAEKEIKQINNLCEEFKGSKDVDTKHCYLETIITED